MILHGTEPVQLTRESETTMPRPKLIALCGGMRSGKDTVADYLKSNHGFVGTAFGDALRAVVGTMYPDARTNREEYRKRMQEVGQHMRAYDPDVWVRCVERVLPLYRAEGLSVVVSDMRQPNEYEAMRRNGAIIIRVDCPAEVRRLRAGVEASYMEHETEQHYARFSTDFVVVNDRAVAHLYRQIDKILEVT